MYQTFEESEFEKQEMNLKKQGDLEGLLKLYLTTFNKYSSAKNLQVYYPKISYYMGRLAMFHELQEFQKKYKDVIFIALMSYFDLQELSWKLFIIGLNYPYLTDLHQSELEKLQEKIEYHDLLKNILFDIHLMPKAS